MSNSKRKRRSPEQVVKALAEGESMLAAGKSSAEVYQKLGVAESTWMRWKQQYGGMKSAEARRLRRVCGFGTVFNAAFLSRHAGQWRPLALPVTAIA